MPLPMNNRLASVVSLETQLRSIEAGLAEKRAAIAEMQNRRELLLKRLAVQTNNPPEDAAEADGTMVALLAANPHAEIDSDELEHAANMQTVIEGRHANWRAAITMIEQAIAKVDDEISQAESDFAAVAPDRDRVMRQFAAAASDYLGQALIDLFNKITPDIIKPLLCLPQAEDSTGRSLISLAGLHLDSRHTLRLEKGADLVHTLVEDRMRFSRSEIEDSLNHLRSLVWAAGNELDIDPEAASAAWPEPRKPNIVPQDNGDADFAAHAERIARADLAGRDHPRDARGWPISQTAG